MTRIRSLVAVLCAAGPFAFAQPAAERLEFEAASIKPAPPPDGHGMIVGMSGGPGSRDPSMVIGHNMTLSGLVAYAYDVLFFQLVAPSWANDSKFLLTAKVPPGATRQQVRVMLQNLLADRFQVKVHTDKKEMPVYELTIGKGGPKFQAAVDVPAGEVTAGPQMKLDEQGFPILERPGWVGRGNKVRMWQPKMTMEDLGKSICGELGRPVIDATGLAGEYNIRMFWVQGSASTGPESAESEAGPSLMRAIQEQLGLKLEAKKSNVDVLVVDHAEKFPSEN